MKPLSEQPLVIREIKIWGEVGAGSVVPFTPKKDAVLAAVPAFFPDDDQIGGVIIRGVSLEKEGIYDGDIGLFRRNVTHREILRDSICIVYIEATGELVAKKIVFGPGDQITLRASGGDIKDMSYHRNDIEIRGLLFGFTRIIGPYGNFTSDPSIPF